MEGPGTGRRHSPCASCRTETPETVGCGGPLCVGGRRIVELLEFGRRWGRNTIPESDSNLAQRSARNLFHCAGGELGFGAAYRDADPRGGLRETADWT